jgi:DNA-binding response OmpR family regulator
MTGKAPLRVLVVEDEAFIAMMISDMLTDLGHEPVGPAMRLDEGLDAARRESIDAAVLDVNLGEAKSFPIADVLRGRRVPFVFATGYGVQGVSEAYKNIRTLEKPFAVDELACALNQAALELHDSPPTDPESRSSPRG